MRTINSHERLSLRFEHRLSRVFIPPIDEVAMETIPVADLLAVQVSVTKIRAR